MPLRKHPDLKKKAKLDDDLVAAKNDPIRLFNRWYELASKVEPRGCSDSFCLTYRDDFGKIPHNNFEMLTGYDHRGFTWTAKQQPYDKQDLIDYPDAEINIWWEECVRQVRIEGQVKFVPE